MGGYQGNEMQEFARLPAAASKAEEELRATVRRRARAGLSTIAVRRFPGDLPAARRWRDELCDILGIGGTR